MKTKFFTIILLIFLIFTTKAQETETANTYSFKQQVQHICNDSNYIKLEIAINNYVMKSFNQAKYINNNILPLDFLVWKNKSDKKKNYDEDYVCKAIIDRQLPKNMFSTSIWDFQFNSNTMTDDMYFYIYTNKYNISVKRCENGNKEVEYDFKTFSVGKDVYLSDKKAELRKSFTSKSHVSMTDFIENCDTCHIENIIYYNKSIITLKNTKDKSLIFNIEIYDQVEKQKQKQFPILISKKVIIEGDKNEALDYLKKNKLDYQEVSSEKIKEEDFKDLD